MTPALLVMFLLGNPQMSNRRYNAQSSIAQNQAAQNILRQVKGLGRGNDTMLAHISPEEAALLRARGGSGIINPRTNVLEFDDSDGGNGDGGGYGGASGGDMGGGGGAGMESGAGDSATGGNVSGDAGGQDANSNGGGYYTDPSNYADNRGADQNAAAPTAGGNLFNLNDAANVILGQTNQSQPASNGGYAVFGGQQSGFQNPDGSITPFQDSPGSALGQSPAGLISYDQDGRSSGVAIDPQTGLVSPNVVYAMTGIQGILDKAAHIVDDKINGTNIPGVLGSLFGTAFGGPLLGAVASKGGDWLNENVFHSPTLGDVAPVNLSGIVEGSHGQNSSHSSAAGGGNPTTSGGNPTDSTAGGQQQDGTQQVLANTPGGQQQPIGDKSAEAANPTSTQNVFAAMSTPENDPTYQAILQQITNARNGKFNQLQMPQQGTAQAATPQMISSTTNTIPLDQQNPILSSTGSKSSSADQSTDLIKRLAVMFGVQ